MAQITMTVVPVFLNGKPLTAVTGVLSGDKFRHACMVEESQKLWRQSRSPNGDDECIQGAGIVHVESGDILYTTPKSI